MDKIIAAFVLIVIIGAAAMTGLIGYKQDTTRQSATAIPQCIDFDPPSTTDTVSFNNEVYGLIKTNAQVAEDYKFREMTKVGETNGKGIYNMGNNYFGEASNPSIIFVLQNVEIKAPYVFNIYLKNGVPMPDFIKNCKAVGGSLTIVEDDADAFPPNSFNKTQIIPVPGDPTVALGYVYDGNKTTSSSVSNLSGATTIGSIFVANKNRNFSLTLHLGTVYLIDGLDAYEYLPTNDPINFTKEAKKSLQLKKITFVQTPAYSWWTPSCKPAIYLYPEHTQDVKVQVKTKGHFILTIPNYPDGGWSVTANPDGRIEYGGAYYPYLYYETKIPTGLVAEPKSGFVVKFSELSSLFDNILPRLGLNEKESSQFKAYWKKVLPIANYYYVGVMSEDEINNLEPLLLSPSPKTIIRVRLYFEGLGAPLKVVEPEFITRLREGFTLVEWGGMVKLEKDSNFTCSQ